MEIRKLVFLILNVAITLVFLTTLTVGGLILGFTEATATVLATDSYCAEDVVLQDDLIAIQVLKTYDRREYDRAGARLIILSVFVLGVAVLGWIVVGSDKKRPKLAYRGRLVYVVCLAVLTAAQLGVCSDFLEWFAHIHSRMKENHIYEYESACLLKLELKVTRNLTIVAAVISVILLLQISQVILGARIIKENQGTKVAPDPTEGHVTNPANGPDLTKDHVTNSSNQPKRTPLAEQPGPLRDTQNENQAAGKDENEPSKKSSRKGKKNVPSMKKKETPSQQLVEQPGTPRETPRESHVTEKESHVTKGSGLEMLPKPQSTDTRPDTLPNPSPPPPDPVRPGARSPDTTSLDLQTYKDSFNDTEHNGGSGNIWDQFGT